MPSPSKATYRRRLRDPRWQQKRLRILARDHWTCQRCGATRRELHVHHLRYHHGMPWDCPNRDLVTLCRLCHRKQHNRKVSIV